MIKYPDKEGKVDIFSQIHYGSTPCVTIIGDPKGLRYLAKLLNALADYNQDESGDPIGEREHIHLHANAQLGNHSSEVELCRADAKGTGELPDFMK